MIKPVFALAISVLLVLGLLYSSSPGSSPNPLLLKLPVRVLLKSEGNTPIEYAKDLKKEDFELLIDGVKKPIVDFFKKERSIAGTSPGRQLVLSFDAVEYGKPLADVVSYVVHSLLTPGDQLLLRTPLHTYQINTQADKNEVLQFILSNLEKDILQWKENKTSSLTILNQSMETLEKKLTAKKGGIRSVLFFINQFTNEWRKFDKIFLLSNLEQYSEFASRLAAEQGEKWLIHFQERDLIPMLTRFQHISEKIKAYASSLPKAYAGDVALLRDSLDKIEKSMLFSEEFPLGELLNVLLGVNINYNVVFFSSRTGGTDPVPSFSPGYEEVLKNIARQTGGISLIADNPNLLEYLQTIINHTDVYYEVVFPLEGEPVDKDKQIEIRVPSSPAGIFYKNQFKQGELKWLMDWMKAEITLSDPVQEGRKLSFTVSGFKMTRDGSAGGEPVLTGMIKVVIRLIDDKTTIVYETEKALKANDPSFNVSLAIPDQYKGYFKLSITAVDLVANKSCQVNKYVKIS